MRVAVVHDWLVVNGGAEKVTSEIIRCYPQADVFCLVDYLSPEDRNAVLHGKQTTTSLIQRLPFAKNHYRNYLALFPTAIEQLDLGKYDLIISSSYAVAKGVITRDDQIHISYCHSPIRYAWDLYHHYLYELGLSWWKRQIAKLVLRYIKNWDKTSTNRVDYFIANSNHVSRRIQKNYQRESQVIYPPVDLSSFEPGNIKGDYFITYGRLVPYKKTALIVEAFNEMPNKKLVVAGDGPELNRIRKLAASNVEILGSVNNEKLVSLLQEAKGLIVAANEDFGITPLEAMACGTPVIAFGKGGYLETITSKTGIFFDQQNVASIISAINLFSNTEFSSEACKKQAEKFSTERFRSELLTFVKSHT